MLSDGKLEYTKDDLKKIDKWIIFGIYYGYPYCCIEAFVRMSPDLNRETNPFKGTGFLCCSECEQYSIEDIVEYINNHRYFSVPFNSDKSILNENVFNIRSDHTHPEHTDRIIEKIDSSPFEIEMDWKAALTIHNTIFSPDIKD